MTTPASKLIDKLEITRLYDLRAQDNSLKEKVTFAHAIGLAQQGLIEGVGPKSGRIEYLRYLAETAIEQPDVRQPESKEHGRSKEQPLNALTNIGAYRQRLNVGTVWALCLCKGFDGARA